MTIASLTSGATATATFPSATISSGGSYTIIAKAELGSDTAPANDQITGTLTIVAPVAAGTYTVGSGQNYASISAAITDSDMRGISGAVVLSLTDASYNEMVTIGAITNASASNTITIKPAANATPTITNSNATTTVDLAGAKFVVIDGSNTSGGTSKDLTIANTSLTGAAVAL